MMAEEASGPRRLLAGMPWPGSLAVRLMAASEVARGDRRQAEGTMPASPCPGDVEHGRTLPPPRDLSSLGRPLTDIVAARRSGGITSGSLGRAELSTLLSVTAEAWPRAFLPFPALGPIVFPLVFDVTGIPAGVYRYEPAQQVILPVRMVERDAVREGLLLQREHGDGAAILFIAVPMARWLHHFGDRGYRGAALQAGHLTDRLYLAAETLGLTYTASGGFAPARADQLLGLDGYHHTTMFSFVIGARPRPRSRGNPHEG
jgi:SagB-type dehydrogenase family enzyme